MIKCIFWHCFFPEPTQLAHQTMGPKPSTMENIIPVITKQPSVLNLLEKSLVNNKLAECENETNLKNHQDEKAICSKDSNPVFSKTLQTSDRQESPVEEQILGVNNYKTCYEIHNSLSRCTRNDERQPDNLKVDTMHLQRQVVPWQMLPKEQKLIQDNRGFGKSIFSLMLNFTNAVKSKKAEENSDKVEARYKYYGGTMVVCPINSIYRLDERVTIGKFWPAGKSCKTGEEKR